MNRIKAQFESKINLIALALCALLSFFWMLLAAERYYFLYAKDYWDLAFYARNIWALLHGSFYNTLIGANYPAEHCIFVNFFFLPIYSLFPDPMLLQYLKIGAFFSGSYIFFLILKKRLHPLIALLAMLAYSIAPANIAMLRHIFNYEPFSIPLIFLIFKALDEKKFKLYIICCFILTLVKEQMPLVVMMFSIFAFLFIKKDKLKWVWIPFLMGLSIFIMDVFIITPYCRKDCAIIQSFYWDRYAQFGKTPADISFFIFTHPAKMLALFLAPLNIKWYNDLFGIWGGLAFFSPQILIPAIPLFLKTLLSNEKWEHVVTGAWYASTFTPFIFLATWNTLNYFQNKWRFYIHVLALIFMFAHALNYWPEWKGLLDTPLENKAIIYKRMIDQIPPQAKVCSDFYALSFLANQKELYEFGDYLDGKLYLSNKRFDTLDHMDYLLINFLDREEGMFDPHHIPKITKLNFDDHWKLMDSVEDIALFKRDENYQKTTQRLIEKSDRPFIKNTSKTIEIESTVSLEGVYFPKIFPKNYKIFPLTMYWKALQTTNISYAMGIKIMSGCSIYYGKYRPIGSTIYPTNIWKKDEYIKEKYFYLLPRMDPGQYLIKINFYNPRKHICIKGTEDNFIIQ